MATTQAIQIIGLEKVEAALRQLPLGIRPLYVKAAQYGHRRMKEHSRPQYGSPAKLAEGVNYSVIGQSHSLQSLEAHIGFLGAGHGKKSSLGALAPTVNYGRRPGRPPSIQGIHAWLHLMNIHVSPLTVQQSIRERGTRGKLFLEQTAEELGAKLPQLVRETEKEIEARWPR